MPTERKLVIQAIDRDGGFIDVINEAKEQLRYRTDNLLNYVLEINGTNPALRTRDVEVGDVLTMPPLL